MPENADAEGSDVYFAFSFSEGICTDAVFNVVCPSETVAAEIASMLNSGAWVEEEEDDEEYYTLKNAESRGVQQLLCQAVSAKKA